ncbi:TIGR02757 family protein [Arcobacter sp. 15-2]|uniref:TIGR02757 family protein n=1 Tax=Arcobacter sp. 15-2 TaxID=3374109 RepID=UPI00399D4671
MENIKQLLDKEVKKRNSLNELTKETPDPLMIAQKNNDEYIALICALFSYGNAHQIVKFLSSLDFNLLEESEECIEKELSNHYYRFQKSSDVIALFIAIKRLKAQDSLENIFRKGYDKNHDVLEGISKIIQNVEEVYAYNSEGYKFLVGTSPKRDKTGHIKQIGNSCYKRYNMFLRWMVRDDNLDMGLWKNVDKKDLILPLDTHTFKVSLKLGLLKRKTYDLKSAILITEALKKFNNEDPIIYDFALYRIGQEKIV